MSKFWNRRNVAVLVLIAVSLAIRLWGVNHGLPSSYYSDERHFINRAMGFGTGDLNPHWFHKPALYMYLLFFEYGLFFLVGKITGMFGTIHDFARLYVNNPSSFLIIGRVTTALFGTATVLLIYKLGKKMYGSGIAFIAACFLAFTFAHVKCSHDVKADIPAAFFAVLSFLYIYQILETGSRRSYSLAGLFAGLGVATKYSPIVLVLPIFAAHLLFLRTERPFPWRRLICGNLLLGFLFLGIGFFIGSPFNFLDSYWIQFNLSRSFQTEAMAGGLATNFSLAGILNLFLNPLIHFSKVILRADSMGAILGALSLLGIPFLIFRGRPGGWLIVLTVLSFMYVSDFMSKSYAAARHLNIIYPFLCLGAAVLVSRVVDIIAPKGHKALGFSHSTLMAVLTILVLFPVAYRVVRFNQRISHKDTRTLAKEWIEQNIPSGTKILVDDYCVPLKMNRERTRELLQKAESESEKGPFTAHAADYYRYYLETVEEPAYYLIEISHPWWKMEEEKEGTFQLFSEYDRDLGNPLKEWGVLSLEEYRDRGCQYLVTTERLIQQYIDSLRSVGFPSFVRFYREVEREAFLLRSFDPRFYEGPGPKVFIYRLLSEREIFSPGEVNGYKGAHASDQLF